MLSINNEVKTYLTNDDVSALAGELAISLRQLGYTGWKCYPIPRGGVPVAYLLQKYMNIEIVDTPEEADFFLDDIIDTGHTLQNYMDSFPARPFFALIDKSRQKDPTSQKSWIVFPWEKDLYKGEEGIEQNIVRLLQYVGEDPARQGLLETPSRVVKAWNFWASGYNRSAEKELKVFEDGAEAYDQMVTVKDIPFYSHCEHHLAPFFGTCTISYIPNGRICGLSKLSRVVDIFARRLQVQERLTDQIADALMENLGPLGVGVQVKARHLCMESRGICQQGHHTITTSLRGVIKEDQKTREEFILIL